MLKHIRILARKKKQGMLNRSEVMHCWAHNFANLRFACLIDFFSFIEISSWGQPVHHSAFTCYEDSSMYCALCFGLLWFRALRRAIQTRSNNESTRLEMAAVRTLNSVNPAHLCQLHETRSRKGRSSASSSPTDMCRCCSLAGAVQRINSGSICLIFMNPCRRGFCQRGYGKLGQRHPLVNPLSECPESK